MNYKEVESAFIFGSRAKGNYRNGSDVDIALKGETLTQTIVSSISSELNEETLLPYKFDVILFHKISNPDLRDHINRIGQRIL